MFLSAYTVVWGWGIALDKLAAVLRREGKVSGNCVDFVLICSVRVIISGRLVPGHRSATLKVPRVTLP